MSKLPAWLLLLMITTCVLCASQGSALAQTAPQGGESTPALGEPADIPEAEPEEGALVEPDAGTHEMETGAFVATSEAELLQLPENEALPQGLYEEVPPPETEEQSSLISITLDDVEMVDVVRMFTRISGANIIASPTNLTGRVTVNLTDVEWRPALESILDMHGLTLLEKTPNSNVFSIAPRQAGAAEPMNVETFFLRYATVTDVEPVVKSMLVPTGTLAVFGSRNALVVRSTAANLSEINSLITDIDQMREQVFIEAKFMELNDEARKDLGVDWGLLQGYGISAGNLTWSQTQQKDWGSGRTDGLLRSDARNNLDTVNQLYDKDNRQFQDFEPVFVEAPPDSGEYLRYDTIVPSRRIDDTLDSRMEVGSELTDTFTKSVSEMRTAVLAADDFKIMLSALKQMNGVRVVSNPKIIVANNQVALIHIGEKEPNIRGSVTAGQQGQANTTTYTLDEDEPYFDFGISLEVTPTVNTASNITVDIIPTLTRFVRDKVAPDGTTFPVTSTKEIKTVFALASGKTAAIGGLTETTESEVEKKIPLLGDIPLIGKYLFTHKTTQNLQKETIIFVTVGLARPENVLKESGLPENTKLVRKRLISTKAEQQAFEADLEQIRQATNEKVSETAGKAKAKLLKRRE